MNYTKTLQSVDTLKALKLLGLEVEQKGAYVHFPCTCGNSSIIKAYGEKKNVYYCPNCKESGHIIKLVMHNKKLDWDGASRLLEEKALAYPAAKITSELNITYDLRYHKFLEQKEITEETALKFGIGVPTGKTMLSGCVAFTVFDEKGMKVAYYGIRMKDEKTVFHNSFNPELYLYNYNHIKPESEVTLTTNMFKCIQLLQNEGIQAICNFGLPYLSPTQLALIELCKYVELIPDVDSAKYMIMQVADLNTYVKFKK